VDAICTNDDVALLHSAVSKQNVDTGFVMLDALDALIELNRRLIWEIVVQVSHA
jgi:hypothetical protein